MRQKRFLHASSVESAILGLIIFILVGAGIYIQLNGNEYATLGADEAPSAMPSPVATPAVGEIIPLPSSTSGGLTLVQTDKVPAFSQEEAMQIVHDLGIPFAFGGDWEGLQVTVSATYGIGTLGHPGPPSMPWVGDRYFPLPGTDVVLDHIENRPMWILDYGNVRAGGSQAEFRHAVYAVDEETRSVLKIWFYDVIESTIEIPEAPSISSAPGG